MHIRMYAAAAILRPAAARLRPAAAKLLQRRCSSVAVGTADAAKIQRWGARLAHDNTYLSYSRNAIISTVAGGALIQYHKAEGKPPLAGAGLLAMGGMFMYVGSALYVLQVYKLSGAMRLSRLAIVWSLFNAIWPATLWSISLSCMLDEYPPWLLEALRMGEAHLPSVLHASLFFDPPALYPVCKVLQGVLAHEEARLQTVRGHAAGRWSLTKPKRAPLTDLDVVSIIVRRIERLMYLQKKLNVYAKSDRAVPTALAAPLLEKLSTEVEQLEMVLESDASPQHDKFSATWWMASLLSSEHRQLRDELDACRALSRRIMAVKFTAVEYAARGQAGVRPPSPEETAIVRRASALRERASGSIISINKM